MAKPPTPPHPLTCKMSRVTFWGEEDETLRAPVFWLTAHIKTWLKAGSSTAQLAVHRRACETHSVVKCRMLLKGVPKKWWWWGEGGGGGTGGEPDALLASQLNNISKSFRCLPGVWRRLTICLYHTVAWGRMRTTKTGHFSNMGGWSYPIARRRVEGRHSYRPGPKTLPTGTCGPSLAWFPT